MRKNVGRFSSIYRMKTTLTARVDGDERKTSGNHVATGDKWSKLNVLFRCAVPKKIWAEICEKDGGDDPQPFASVTSPLSSRPVAMIKRKDKDKVVFEAQVSLLRDDVPDQWTCDVSAFLVDSNARIVADSETWTIGISPKEFNASGGFPFKIEAVSFREDITWGLDKMPNLGYAFRITGDNRSVLLVNTDIVAGDSSFAKILLDKKSNDPTRDAMVCAIAKGAIASFLYAALFRVGSLDDGTINDGERKCLSAFVSYCAKNVPSFDPPRDDLENVLGEIKEMYREYPPELYNTIQQFGDAAFNSKNEKKTIVKALGD